jgi:hypothetical protein
MKYTFVLERDAPKFLCMPVLFYFFARKRSRAVAQLVEALPYKPEGRVFDSRFCHWNFSLT